MRRATKQRPTSFVPKQKLYAKKLEPIDERQAAQEFSNVVLPFSAGDLAQAANRTKEAAKGWKMGRSLPSGSSLIMLASQIPAVKKWLLHKIERGADPQFDSPEIVTAMLTTLQALADRPGPEGEAVRGILRSIARGNPNE